MMKRMFRDPDVQAELEANGFVKRPWLDAAEVRHLRAGYGELAVQTPEGYAFSMAMLDTAGKAAVRRAVLGVFAPRLRDTFVDPLPLLCTFMTLKGGEMPQSTPSHQDWTFVDETEGDRSIHIWCPLEATHERNGTLCFVPGSHRLRRYPRLAEIANSAYKPYWHALRQVERALPAQAGEAIFFDSAVVHASSPNQTDSIRLVASAIVVPAASKQVLYYQNAADTSMVDEYLSGVDYFIQKPFGTRPDTLLRTIPQTILPDVEAELGGLYPEVNLAKGHR
jgi:hypothetical protein